MEKGLQRCLASRLPYQRSPLLSFISVRSCKQMSDVQKQLTRVQTPQREKRVSVVWMDPCSITWQPSHLLAQSNALLTPPILYSYDATDACKI